MFYTPEFTYCRERLLTDNYSYPPIGVCASVPTPCKEGVSYPDHYYCEKYHLCQNGTLVVWDCQPGFRFHVTMAECVYPVDTPVNCNYRCHTTTAPPPTTQTTEEFTATTRYVTPVTTLDVTEVSQTTINVTPDVGKFDLHFPFFVTSTYSPFSPDQIGSLLTQPFVVLLHFFLSSYRLHPFFC